MNLLPSEDWFRYELLARHVQAPTKASSRWVAWVDADSFSLRHLTDVLMEAGMPVVVELPGAMGLVEAQGVEVATWQVTNH